MKARGSMILYLAASAVLLAIVAIAAQGNPATAAISDPTRGGRLSDYTDGPRTVVLSVGWNDVCYSGPTQSVSEATAGIAGNFAIMYRLGEDHFFERWVPGRPDISTMATLGPYDQVLILVTAAGAEWSMEITTPPSGPPELATGWNNVCYTGPSLPVEEATADWDSFAILYQLLPGVWCRYVPDRPDISTCTVLNTFDSVIVLVAEGPEFCGPVFPTTFAGTVTIDGVPAADGTTITALDSDGVSWATATTSGGSYNMDVPATMPVTEPCFPGGTISFTCDGASATETGSATGGLKDLNLSCGAPAIMCGDVDCDYDVDAVDALFILQHVVGLRPELCQCPGP